MSRISLDPNRPPFGQLVEQAAIFAHEGLTAFQDSHRESPETAVSLAPESPHLTMVGQDLVYGVQFLGSFSGIDNSFLWGWKNINGYPDEVLAVANGVLAMGEQAGVAEFRTAMQQLESESDVYPLLFAVVRTTGNPCIRRLPTEHGFAYFLAEGFELPPSRVVATQRAIGEAISTGRVQDHVAALQGYLDLRPGVTARGTDTGLVIDCSDGPLEIDLDAQRRIASMRFEINEETKHGLRT